MGRETEDLDFMVTTPTGAQRILITRLGGYAKRHRVLVRDPSGRELGRLQQVSSFWRQLRTTRLSMVLECGEQRLGSTDICIEPAKKRFVEVHAPVLDNSGSAVATVHRNWQYVDTISDFFNYRLECPRPLVHPLPELILATAFCHYLYDRLAVGGPLDSYNRFGRGGTWHDPRESKPR